MPGVGAGPLCVALCECLFVFDSLFGFPHLKSCFLNLNYSEIWIWLDLLETIFDLIWIIDTFLIVDDFFL